MPTANSFPNGIGVGPDGALWFTQKVQSEVGRITTAGSITEFSLAPAPVPNAGITTGSDGNLWITGDHSIVRFAPAAAPTPTPTVPSVTPTVTPPVGTGPAAAVPMLDPVALLLLALALAGGGLFLIRRS